MINLLRGMALACAVLLSCSQAQTSAPPEPMRVGAGVSPPRLLRKVEPQYTQDAERSGVQGTVLLELTVDEKGRAVDVTVLSPLGFGLDERAVAAVQSWEFAPGMKDGVPVGILAEVEVNFRFQGMGFDEKLEQRRTLFNGAVQRLSNPAGKLAQIESGVQTILKLSKQKFAPAMCLAGVWMISGEHLPKDEAAGMELIRKSADQRHGPALYEVAIRRIEGRQLPKDLEKGLQDMRDAAVLGSVNAQYYLGQQYEKGVDVEPDPERAKRYYWLCSAKGFTGCEVRLGRMLMDNPGRRERDYVQAIALFQLAADQGTPEAKKILDAELPKLTPDQTRWVATAKNQIVRK